MKSLLEQFTKGFDMSGEEQQELINGYNKILTKMQEHFMRTEYIEASKQAKLLATFLEVKAGNVIENI